MGCCQTAQNGPILKIFWSELFKIFNPGLLQLLGVNQCLGVAPSDWSHFWFFLYFFFNFWAFCLKWKNILKYQKRWFQPANFVQSTCLLFEIHNIHPTARKLGSLSKGQGGKNFIPCPNPVSDKYPFYYLIEPNDSCT